MKSDQIRGQNLGIIISLVVQYLLGMAVNLYVKFPNHEGIGQMWAFAKRQVLVDLHLLVGLGLLISSIMFLVRVTKAKRADLKTPAWIGFLAIVTAAFGGSQYVPTQSEIYSYLMAMSFIVALTAYGWSLLKVSSAT